MDIPCKPASEKNGIRNRKCGLLIGSSLSGEEMHKYVAETHGWSSYVVCSTAARSSLALIVDVGARRIHAPEGVQQCIPTADATEVA
eukprot:14281762-Alexandrium_andersonii.AAC.1